VIETYIVAGIALVVAGGVIGILGTVCLGIRRDDRPGGFPAETSDCIAHAARRLTGAGTRGPDLTGTGNSQEARRVQPGPEALV
jgi:hypothetical protein